MSYFNKEASLTYLTLTEIAFDNYLISESDYYERLFLLRQFCEPNDKDTISNIDLHISDLNDWYHYGQQSEYFYSDDDDAKMSYDELKNAKGEDDFQGNDFDPLLHFISAISGKISKWEFHKTDSDFFPSIPHGHAIINHKIKLDSYKGFIYKNNQQCDREKRQFIVDLWNDNSFRETARETISYYLTNYPHYHWRVAHPSRIPRRRR